MHVTLARFITDHCVRCSSASYALKALSADFLGQLPAKARGSWRRSRLIHELVSAGFPVAINPATRTYVAGGLSPRGELRPVNGHLELSTNA